MFEAADTPALRFLAEHGEYRRATSTFPSLTPVCLRSIATGSHPDVHDIPHLVWWHRGEQRIVEYGSSFGAVRAAGLARSLRDTIVDLNARAPGSPTPRRSTRRSRTTGLTTAAINITCYRGTHRHLPTIPGVPAVYGPKRFFFYSLYESDRTGAPIAVRNRALGSIDAYAASVGRWLVTRDGFDLLVYYLPDYDFASHATGPDSAHEALARSDAAIAALMDAAGGPDEFLERYAVIVCSDHGQSHVEQVARLDAGDDLVTASNRAAMVYTDDPAASPSASTRSRRRASSSSRRTGSWSRVATATRTTRCSTRFPTVARVPRRRCATRTPARCSSRPRPAGSSPTSPAATTSAAAVTARSSEPTRRCRCCRRPRPPPASITGIKETVLRHFGLAGRRTQRVGSLAPCPRSLPGRHALCAPRTTGSSLRSSAWSG